jgi:hypothetical protein
MQPTVAYPHAARPGHERRMPLASRETRTAPARLALIAGVAGLLADVTYVLALALPHGNAAGPFVASLFGPLIAGMSVTLYLFLATERATFAGLLAAIFNVVAGGLVTAMLLVQVSVDEVEASLSPAVNDALEHVEFGLDLSWDVFLVAGTILFGCAMIANRRFGRVLGVSGIIVAVALYALNFATFPEPPASSGLVDLGPLIGLWYAAVSVQALRLWRASARTPTSIAVGNPHPKRGGGQ